MSDSEDEDFAFFGTPLEPFEEDAVPRKKPVSVEDQIATDKHGRRRFHGAFTGGFSAGFFNSVGSLEGWKPSTFKSSRNERSELQQQLPSHFMDDEDTEEFGIAPQVLRTKTEYASTKRAWNKRERNTGPIPGEPVLKTILKPAKRTTGILLLVKMGWKPGQDIGEKLEKTTKKLKPTNQSKQKVYGCARGPEDSTYSAAASHDSSDSDVEDEIYRELGKQAPSFVCKEDNMGLGYKGLDRNALNFGIKSSQPLRLTDQYNKSIKVSGQAFGVGAFEEEDDDIYATEDKSQYDFILEPLSQRSKKPKNVPAITDGSNVILGFVKATFKEKAKQYPGPLVPSSFSGKHVVKQSRFNVVPEVQKPASSKQVLDANLRSAILGTQQLPIRIKEEKPDEEAPKNKIDNDPSKPSHNGGSSWKPFSSDPAKQERYEKYLNLIKIGAKDLVHTVLLNTMSDLERDSEMREFESAARLYKGNIMSDRFTHGQSLDDDTVVSREKTVREEVVRKRVTSDWAPHPVVCKRFNIKPPDNVSGTTLQNVAESKKKPKFSVFDFLNTSKTTSLINMIESNAQGESDSNFDGKEVKCEIVSGLAVSRSRTPDTPPEIEEIQPGSNKPEIKNNAPLLFEDDEAFEEPADKMDLFKAIFLDSDEGSDDEKQNDEKQTNEEEKQDNSKTINVLRNTSPPRGIFANIDLDKLSSRKPPPSKDSNDVLKITAPPQSIFENQTKPEETVIKTEPVEVPDSYGPILPSSTGEKPKSYVNLKLDVNDERWVEKPSKEKHSRSKHHHHKKKHKKEKKQDKHKKKKKKKYSSSESSSESD